MLKQYVVEEAYTDNYFVLLYVDGVLQNQQILAYYDLPGYTKSIEDSGYTRAYYKPKYYKMINDLVDQYLNALEQYNEAARNPLILSEKEEKLYRTITHFKEYCDDEWSTKLRKMVKEVKEALKRNDISTPTQLDIYRVCEIADKALNLEERLKNGTCRETTDGEE